MDEMFIEARLQNLVDVENAQPSFSKGYLKRCPFGCNIILTSTDDMKRRYNLMGHEIATPTMKKRPRVTKDKHIEH